MAYFKQSAQPDPAHESDLWEQPDGTVQLCATGAKGGAGPVWLTIGNATTGVDAGPVMSVSAGTGISVDHTTGAITVTNAGVTSASAGSGISVDASTGAVTVTNAGVTSVSAGTAISVDASTGDLTVTNTAPEPADGITGTLTGGTLPVATGAGTLGDSILTQSGTTALLPANGTLSALPSGNDGGSLSVLAGNGVAGNGVGGDLALAAGDAIGQGLGGAVSIVGGSALGGAYFPGNAVLRGGRATSSGNKSAFAEIQGGNSFSFDGIGGGDARVIGGQGDGPGGDVIIAGGNSGGNMGGGSDVAGSVHLAPGTGGTVPGVVDITGPFVLVDQSAPVDAVADSAVLGSAPADSDLTVTALVKGVTAVPITVTRINPGGTTALSVATTGPLASAAVNAAGDGYAIGDAGTIAVGTGGTYTVSGVSGVARAITVVNQGTKTFTVAGDVHLWHPPASTFNVTGSTGNDGAYTVVSATFGAATDIVVVETIPSAVADGTLSSSSGIGSVDTVTLSAAGTGYASVTGAATATTSGAGDGNLTLDTTITPRDILVTLATTTGTITSIANDVEAAVEGDHTSAGGGLGAGDIVAVVVEGAGTGLVDAHVLETLTGGVDGTPGAQNEMRGASGAMYFCTTAATVATSGAWQKVTLGAL